MRRRGGVRAGARGGGGGYVLGEGGGYVKEAQHGKGGW